MAAVSVGDTVFVPGDMHGVVKFIGPVTGKRGIFAGVQLATEYAPRGKNSGEVDGRYYFKTTIPGSGIFLPLEKAVKKASAGSGLGVRGSPGPGTPTRLTSFNQGRKDTGTGQNQLQSIHRSWRQGRGQQVRRSNHPSEENPSRARRAHCGRSTPRQRGRWQRPRQGPVALAWRKARLEVQGNIGQARE